MAVQPLIGLEAAEYARHGWPLVLLPPNSKGEHGMRKHWNARQNAATNPELVARWHGNVGLLLAFAGIASIDIDNLDAAHAWLEERGINLMHLLSAHDAVRIDSGRPGRAKLLYRVPDDVDPETLLTQRIQAEDRAVILELRCAGRGGVSMQDVLPPSIHPDTGQPYRWKGDWRKVPVMPPELAALWFDNLPSEATTDAPRAPLGYAGGAEFVGVMARLAAAGCKPYSVRAGEGRAHCPVHRGESGTTLHINETVEGKVLLHCHAGCDWRAVFDSLGFGPAEPVRMSAGGPKAAPDGPDSCPGPDILPPIPEALCALPGRMGEVQEWIVSTMYKPHWGVAGLVTLALMDFMAMMNTRIASRSGLAMGEFFMVLAPSAFGKESLRTPFRKLSEFAMRERLALADLHFSAPSSMQGLQEMLMGSRAMAMLPDEFGDWIAKGDKEHHREQAMAHLMQVYGNPFGTVDVPRAISKKLTPVKEPRMVLFGTSTGARFSEVINGSIADRGFLNRFVMLPVGDGPLEIGSLTDDPLAYEIPQALASLAKRICPGAQTLTFDDDAIEYKNAHLRAVLDPLSDSDNRLAGRLSEQAARIAAAFALNEGRCVIDVRDMAAAFEIREGLYQRTAAFFASEASLTGDNPTMRALEQARNTLKRHGSMSRSRLRDHARQFRRLSVREQNDVIRALIVEGVVQEVAGRLYWNEGN